MMITQIITFDYRDNAVRLRITPSDDWTELSEEVIKGLDLYSLDKSIYFHVTNDMKAFLLSQIKNDVLPKDYSVSPILYNTIQGLSHINQTAMEYGKPYVIDYDQHNWLVNDLSDGNTINVSKTFLDWASIGFCELYTFKSIIKSDLMCLPSAESNIDRIRNAFRKDNNSINIEAYDFSHMKLTAAAIKRNVRNGYVTKLATLYGVYGETSDIDKEMFTEVFLRNEIYISTPPEKLWFKLKLNE